MLETFKEKINNDFTRGKVEEVIDVYAHIRISQRARADNVIKLYASKDEKNIQNQIKLSKH